MTFWGNTLPDYALDEDYMVQCLPTKLCQAIKKHHFSRAWLGQKLETFIDTYSLLYPFKIVSKRKNCIFVNTCVGIFPQANFWSFHFLHICF
jgi:hypothetical protein